VRRGMSVARQMLALQVVAVLLAVLGVTPVLAVYQDRAFRDAETRRALATAETVAGTAVLQAGLASGTEAGVAGEAERTRSVSGSAVIAVRDATGSVVYSSDPDRTVPTAAGSGTDVRVVDGDPRLIAATVPVIASASRGAVRVGDLTGWVTVARAYPRAWQRIGAVAPALVTYVLVGAAVGLLGSLLISRRIKRVTFDLEPQEIRGLVEHREAMLHGLREGVVATDLNGRVTVANDEARRLLELDAAVLGSDVADLGLDPLLGDVLCGRAEAGDLPVASAGRMLVLNQVPVRHEGRLLGWVTTVRDRTEHVELVSQVTAWRDTTDLLRAQAHEFSNRMHTVAGLVELGEYDELRGFVASQRAARAGWSDVVLRCVRDRTLAALLVAKEAQASERGVTLELDPESSLDPLPPETAEDVLTVVGNLVDNAMEIVSPHRGVVRVSVHGTADGVRLAVHDDGPGPDPESLDRIFEQGYSTKGEAERTRGWGLALCRLACERRGGWIRADRTDDATTFEAWLPNALESGRTAHRG
jgi:two-component system, CitB family, sensor kinase